MVNYSRHNKKWGINEILALEREYSLLELPINDISIRHKRTPFSILLRLQKENIIVNAVCPGYCATNMSSYKGHKSPAEGADTPVWVATRHGSVNDLTGGFYYERQLIGW